MRASFTMLRASGRARQMVMFNVLFFTGMWLSKTVQPLYFQAHGRLEYFGLSYSAMALAGTVAFLAGTIGDRIGYGLTMRLGAALYAVGMALRIFYGSPVLALVSGVLAGLGASTALVGIRPWITGIGDEKSWPRLLALRSMSCDLGSAIGTGAAGIALTLVGLKGGAAVVLLAAAALPLLAATVIPKLGARPAPVIAPSDEAAESESSQVADEPDESDSSLRGLVTRHRGLTIGVISLGFLTGGYIAFLAPYLPVILHDKGVPLAAVGGLLALASIIRVLAAPIFATYVTSGRAVPSLALAEIASAAVTLLLAFQVGPWVAAVVVLVRAVVLGMSVLSEELVQLSMFPRRLAASYFGLAQTAFLAGDAVGGTASGFLYTHVGLRVTVGIAAGLIMLNGIVYPWFAARQRRRFTPERVLVDVNA